MNNHYGSMNGFDCMAS